jgi:hypothetical protein
MNETIKIFTEITPLDALKLLVENNGRPIENMAFRDTNTDKWTSGVFDSICTSSDRLPFGDAKRGPYKYCAKVTEIDPCKAPDGCHELEPWMAYVGLEPKCDSGYRCSFFYAQVGKTWIAGYDPNTTDTHYAIDVRTEWAQKHFPEHCRIRNYQEPDPFEEWYKTVKCVSVAIAPDYKHEMRQAYELGQANAK